jgi:hypothetical protein
LTPASAVSGVVDKTRLQFTGSPVWVQTGPGFKIAGKGAATSEDEAE